MRCVIQPKDLSNAKKEEEKNEEGRKKKRRKFTFLPLKKAELANPNEEKEECT
jgi:hypothetical protein